MGRSEKGASVMTRLTRTGENEAPAKPPDASTSAYIRWASTTHSSLKKGYFGMSPLTWQAHRPLVIDVPSEDSASSPGPRL